MRRSWNRCYDGGTDPAGRPAQVAELSSLAFTLGLSAYDAAYLELAERQGCPLLTADERLADISRAQGVTVLPVT